MESCAFGTVRETNNYHIILVILIPLVSGENLRRLKQGTCNGNKESGI